MLLPCMSLEKSDRLNGRSILQKGSLGGETPHETRNVCARVLLYCRGQHRFLVLN